jgi:hypothetical protein
MLNYFERELIRSIRADDGARCLRCNASLPAGAALRSEGLCAACAQGETVQASA